MPNILLEAAYRYIKNGLCVIPAGADKAPLPRTEWMSLQERLITEAEAAERFADPRAEYIAIVCGKSSGNLEVIDIDSKYDLTGTLYDAYRQAIEDNADGLFDRLLIIQSRSGGYHFYYRCEEIEGNQKLARRHSTADELKADPNDKVKVLIETRGRKGIIIAPPSAGYKTVQNTNVPTITRDERTILLTLARSFNEIIEEPVKVHKQTTYDPKEYGISPFDDYNKRGDLNALLERHGWVVVKDNENKTIYRRPGKSEGTSGNFNKEKNWFSVFTTSSIFEAQKAYLPYAVYCTLECKGDFKKAAARLLADGYGERRINFGPQLERKVFKQKQEGKSTTELITYVMQETKKSQEESLEVVEQLERVWGEKICTFWEVSDKLKVTVNRTRLVDFLHTNGGYSLYYYNKDSTIFKVVKCQDGFVEEVATEDLKKFLQRYINSLPDTFDGGITSSDLMEEVLKGSATLFSDGILEFLPRSEFDFLKDTDECAFFPFRNGVAVVSRHSIALRKYSEINKVIWKTQVKDYDLRIDPGINYPDVEYFRFLECISGSDMEKIEYAMTLIGYLLHGFKDPTKAFAVILAEETESEKEGGGTGKGIFFHAIGHLIKKDIIDGKTFKSDKSFAFQRVGLDTKLVVFEDVKKNVDFEAFYPMITEGMTVEKKNKDELFIPYADSPKIGFTTNYTVNAVGNHGKRRQRVFEFTPFFGPGKTPEEFFGHKLFGDWDDYEWNRFYNLMFMCVQAFLQDGVKEMGASVKNKRKQVRISWGDEFLEWFDENLEELGKGYRFFMEVYKEFLQGAEFVEKDYTMKRFKSALKSTTDVLGYSLHQRKNRSANNARMVCVRAKGAPEPTGSDLAAKVERIATLL